MNEIEDWLRNFLTEFRKRYDLISDEQKASISVSDNFMPPCQMLFLSFQTVNFQRLIVTHDKDRNDEEITVCEFIPPYEAVDALESILNDPKWDRELTTKNREYHPEATNFRDMLEWTFINTIQDLRRYLFVEPSQTFIELKMPLAADSFIWHVRGNITNFDSTKMIEEIMEDAKRQAATAKIVEPPSVKPPGHAIIAFCTYFNPPIWIGKPPEKTFKEKALGYVSSPKRAFDTKYKGKIVVVYESGFIVLGEENAITAVRMFNEIMGACLLDGLSFRAIREPDISRASVDPSSLTLGSYGSGESFLMQQLFYDDWMGGSTPSHLPSVDRREIEKKKILHSIQIADRLTQDPNMSDFLCLLIEAYTYFESSEYLQSFVLSWMIIEKSISLTWKKFLLDMPEEQVNSSRRNKLTNPTYRTIDNILKTLKFAGRLPFGDYDNLMKLKKKRNDVIHKGESVAQDDTEKCFETAKRFVREQCTV